MKFRPSRKLIGIASALALVLFVSNPEIFALGYVISSIGFDVFLLFLTFQLKDQFQYLLGLFFSLVGKKVATPKADPCIPKSVDDKNTKM